VRLHIYHHWSDTPQWAISIDRKLELIIKQQEDIMSSFDDLATQLNAISVEVTTIKGDVDTLLAKLAAIPPAGLTTQQQAALNAAVATATNIGKSLSAIDLETHPVVAPPAPTLTSIAPNTGPTAGNTAVTLTGTGFTGATGVSIDSVLATNLVVVSDTSITATTPAGPSGAQSVVVSTPSGSSAANTLFTYIAAAPALSSILPTTGPIAGGTALTLTGAGFTGATGVTVGGVVTPFVVANDTTITLTTIAAAAGVAPIVVTTPAGVTDGTVSYTFA
jgi:IPT/TIG domain